MSDFFDEKLKQANAKLTKERYLQKRSVFTLPCGHEIDGGWIRIRDEGNKVTMSLKIVDGDKIHNQKETCIEVGSMENAEKFLTMIGCEKKAYQENYRELWVLDNVEITIDEWPFLEPFVEIEGKSEEEVKHVSEKLGLDYDEAFFGAVDTLYHNRYNVSKDKINNETPRIVFGEDNPFK